MTLTEFLLARIAEEQAVAQGLIDEGPWNDFHGRDTAGPTRDDEYAALHIGAGRVLAECEAKRRIAEEHPRCDIHDRPGRECDACQTCGDGSIWPCPTLLYAAAIYSDHPDYRDEWKP